MLCEVGFGPGTAGWGGVGPRTSFGTCTPTWCYVRDGVERGTSTPTWCYVFGMLRKENMLLRLHMSLTCASICLMLRLENMLLPLHVFLTYASVCLMLQQVATLAHTFQWRHNASITSSISEKLPECLWQSWKRCFWAVWACDLLDQRAFPNLFPNVIKKW